MVPCLAAPLRVFMRVCAGDGPAWAEGRLGCVGASSGEQRAGEMPAAGGDAIGADRDASEIEVLGEPFRVGEEQRRGQTVRQCRGEVSAGGTVCAAGFPPGRMSTIAQVAAISVTGRPSTALSR